jgi:hypothetical protein
MTRNTHYHSKTEWMDTVRKHWTKVRQKPSRASTGSCSTTSWVWNFSFKELRWLSLSSFNACNMYLSLQVDKNEGVEGEGFIPLWISTSYFHFIYSFCHPCYFREHQLKYPTFSLLPLTHVGGWGCDVSAPCSDHLLPVSLAITESLYNHKPKSTLFLELTFCHGISHSSRKSRHYTSLLVAPWFPSLVLLLWLGLQVVCCVGMQRTDTLALLLILVGVLWVEKMLAISLSCMTFEYFYYFLIHYSFMCASVCGWVHVCVCAHACVLLNAHAIVCVHRTEDNLQLLIFSFYRVSSKGWIRVIGLGNRYPNLLSHVAGPISFFYHS